MNRLWVRLTLAFMLVTLVAVGTTSALANFSIGNQFRQFIARPDVFFRNGLTEELIAFYQQRGSWNGVGEVVRAFNQPPRGPGGGPAPGGPGPRFGPPVLIADANGQIVFDERSGRMGQVFNRTEREAALPLTSNGALIGYIWLGGPPPQVIGTPELAFLNQLRGSLLIAAFAAGGASVLLGLLISRMLSAPLATLARTAHAFAARDLSRRVPVNEMTPLIEVTEVAHAFNNMADSLQAAETMRRNLMADVAHELRTPLTVIQGNLRALLDGVYPLEMKEVATLYDETRLLSRLVDDVRELALAESGQLQLNMQAVDVAALLRATTERFATAADAQNIALQLEPSAPFPMIHADPDRVAQVLHNLVNNALRHTPNGGRITLAAKTQAARVQMSVSDSGEGIAAADLPHIFERFYRGDKSRARRTGGTGLGLTIAKTLVEAMGGAMGVESEVGKGSRFWFELKRED